MLKNECKDKVKNKKLFFPLITILSIKFRFFLKDKIKSLKIHK